MSFETLNKVKSVASLPYKLGRYRPLRGNWFGPYLWKALTKGQILDSPLHVIVSVVDHFEPAHRFGDAAAVESVKAWCEGYATQVAGISDSNGRPPQHSWFYRAEYPNHGCLQELSKYCFEGYGEIEFHLHHGHDTHESFRDKLEQGLDFFNQHGAMLTLEPTPRRRFAYIAGNWSLDNGSCDDSKSGCNTELAALRDAGCFSDFTCPALGSKAQPRTSNSIYYATDDPRPKSYDVGQAASVGGQATGDLMIFQGPCGFDWRSCEFEDSAVESYSPHARRRLQAWLSPRIHVVGRPEWIFIKLHCHGMQSKDLWCSPKIREMFQWMAEDWNKGRYRLHYVNAREAYNIVKAAEQGESGSPAEYLDYTIPQPANRQISCSSPWTLLEKSPSILRLAINSESTSQLRIASTSFDSIEGALNQVVIEHDGPLAARIKVLANSNVTAWRGDFPCDLPIGQWNRINCSDSPPTVSIIPA
jgi:hypothetical protein